VGGGVEGDGIAALSRPLRRFPTIRDFAEGEASNERAERASSRVADERRQLPPGSSDTDDEDERKRRTSAQTQSPAHELRGLEKEEVRRAVLPRAGSARAGGRRQAVKLFATRHSHAVLYVHAVWATKKRVAVLDSALLFRLSQQATITAHALGAALLAFGGASDHVHLLVRYRPDLSAAVLLRGLKAGMTLAIRREVSSLPDFSWQTGYGAFSVGSSELDRTVAYISNQERHHTAGTIWPDLEFED
jgi:putative transposase